MPKELRTAPGMRERSPGVWELIVECGRDPVTGKRRQKSRTFHGNLREATKARSELLTEVSHGKHKGTKVTVNELFGDWIAELERKGRSPSTIHNYDKTYRRNIAPTLASKPVEKITTKMLTDLYGEHQRRGLAPRTVYQIHATISSMMTQACRWGWRDSNPAQWAEPPALPNTVPVVPTPDDVRALMKAAEESRRPEYARAIFVAASTGVRRGELCAIRRHRDIDWDRKVLTVAHNIIDLNGRPPEEAPTKNRRVRKLAVDDHTLALLAKQVEMLERRSGEVGVELDPDPFVFSDSVDGSEPWRPGAVTLYFGRLRKRVGLDHIQFHSLRKFMETYGQDLGFAASQVAMRAGHDPSVAARHYTGKIAEADRAIADGISGLLLGGS